jgi:hypothetical protein
VSTQTRTPEEIYEEIKALSPARFEPSSTVAEKIAWAETRVGQLTSEVELWRQLHAVLPYPSPPWQRVAALRASDGAFEQLLNMEDRLERLREQAARAKPCGDLPAKEER